MPRCHPGDIVAQNFEIVREIGRGGVGIVFVAVDRRLDRDVALKLMKSMDETEPDPREVERFLSEARAVAKLTGPHIAHVYESGVLDDGTPYIVMEYLIGRGLDKILARRTKLPVAEAVNCVLQACAGVSQAHARGIIHRDLKPANLFMDESHNARPCLKVLDFGVAKLRFEALQLTRTDQILGTPLYMSPEQRRAAENVDERTDIWSLGVILYQLLTGVVPFAAESAEDLEKQILRVTPVAPNLIESAVTGELSSVVMKCLEKEPQHRYANVSELASQLAPYDRAFGEELADEVVRLLALEPVRPSLRVAMFRSASSEPGAPVPDDNAKEWAEPNWSDEDTLLQALLNRSLDERPIVFLVGAGLTASVRGQPGVPLADGLVQLVRAYYQGRELEQFDRVIGSAGARRYQAAFSRLLATHGVRAVNRTVRRAVLQARLHDPPLEALAGERDACAALERDQAGWYLAPAVQALGQILAAFPSRFGNLVLTSNFDPLLEIAINRAGGHPHRLAIQADGQVAPLRDDVCNVVHLNGNWCHGATLHAPGQPTQDKPKLAQTLAHLLRGKTLAVLGYSGSDEVLIRNLLQVVTNADIVGSSEDGLDVLWSLYSADRKHIMRQYNELIGACSEAIGHSRIVFYRGVDLHRVFPALRAELARELPSQDRPMKLPPLSGERTNPGGDTLVSGHAPPSIDELRDADLLDASSDLERTK